MWEKTWIIFFILIFFSNVAHSIEIFKLRWQKYVGKYNHWDTNHSLITENKVYHATKGNKDGPDSYDKLYVYNASGRLLWSFSSPDGGDIDLSGVTVYKSYVAVGCENGYVYMLDSHTGKLRWKFKTGNNIYSSPALGDIDGDGEIEVVVGSWDNYIYCLSGRDGKLKWRFKTGNWVYSSNRNAV